MTEPTRIDMSSHYQLPKRYTSDRPQQTETWRLLLLPLLLLSFLAGLFIDALIDEETNPTADDRGFVNVEGHEGEVLVVSLDGDLLWTTEAELHEAAGHG
jgi:hypothetical protein